MASLSIVTTLYKSESYVHEFYERCRKVLQRLGISQYEFVFVDDGSPDNSLEEALKLHSQDKRVSVVQLSRNFGHHKAIMTGLAHAEGDFVFLIDVDLEEEPELLEKMWAEAQSDKSIDVIYGVQETRKGRFFERWSGLLFYWAFNWLADNAKVEKNFCTIRLMKKNYVQSLIRFQEKEFYFAPICAVTGYNQKPMVIKKHSTSETTYRFLTKYHMLINSVLTFTNKPLFFVFYFGLFITSCSIAMGIYFIAMKLLFDSTMSGWTSLIVSIWFLGGCIILFLGIVAIYISKIFIETKGRPFSIVRQLHARREELSL